MVTRHKRGAALGSVAKKGWEDQVRHNGATAFYYEYTIKDHLGNARVNFRANGAAVTFLQELHYYPFGMLMEGIGTAKVTDNGYKYNGKELNEDLGLNLSDYGARWYDGAVGRWWSIDPMGEKALNLSSYSYVGDNPMILIDPSGMFSEAYDFAFQSSSENMQHKGENQLARLTAQQENRPSTVHILALDGSDKKAIDGAIKVLEKCAKAAGLNVIFKRENPNKFDISKMPLTDAVAVVGGTKTESADFILNKIDHNYLSEDFQRNLAPGSSFRTDDPSTIPETSDGYSGWGYVIATSTQGENTNEYWGVNTMSEFVGLQILHGMGHLSGILHCSACTGGGQYENGFMDNGTHLKAQMSHYYKGDVNRLILDTKHNFPELISKIQNRFGGVKGP